MVVAGSRWSLSLSPARSEPRCVDSPITEERRDRENAEFAASFQATKEKEEDEEYGEDEEVVAERSPLEEEEENEGVRGGWACGRGVTGVAMWPVTPSNSSP